jgi:hypothetical protein
MFECLSGKPKAQHTVGAFYPCPKQYLKACIISLKDKMWLLGSYVKEIVLQDKW